MKAFAEPGFQPVCVFIKPFCPGDIAIVKTQPGCLLLDQESMVLSIVHDESCKSISL
jgi:hypothetical protein